MLWESARLAIMASMLSLQAALSTSLDVSIAGLCALLALAHSNISTADARSMAALASAQLVASFVSHSGTFQGTSVRVHHQAVSTRTEGA
jgi:hypothetical protein